MSEQQVMLTGDADVVRSTKPSNPKDALGIKKVPFSTVSEIVVAEMGLGMLEGAVKYGKHNYRVIGVRASIYFDAARRHLADWWEGEDVDPDSFVGLNHITKALTSLAVLRDAMVMGMLEDDRPPKAPPDWQKDLNDKTRLLMEQWPSPKQPYTEKNKNDTR